MSERRADVRAMACIALVAVLAFGLCLGGDFVYDDVHSVRENAALTSLANVPRFFVDVQTFSSLDCRLYRPVLLTTYAVDAVVGGMHPWPFKLTNLLLHLAAALLVFSIARRLGVHRTAAALGACLFAAHPLASEAINSVSGRSNVLMVVGLLAAVRFHIAAMRGYRFATCGTVLCGAISMGSKEPGMILPVLLVILEFLRCLRGPEVTRNYRGVALRIAPVIALVVGYVWLRSHMLGAASFGVNAWQGADAHSGYGRGMVTQFATMATLLPRALVQAVVPLGLTMDPVIEYRHDLAAPAVLIGGSVLMIATALGLRAPRRHPALFLGTCLAWGCALPWVIKPLNLPFLEHRLYGVLAGLAFVVMAVLPRCEVRLVPVPRRIGLAAIVVIFAWLAGSRSLEFRTEEGLWTVELQRNPESQMAMAGMAVCHMAAQRHAAARPLLERLVQAHPDRRDARMNLVEVELRCADGDPAATVRHARFLVDRWANNPFYWLLYSRTLAAQGVRDGHAEDFDAAVAAALHCLEIAEPKGLVFRTAAGARKLQGDLDAAIALLDESVRRGLDHSSVLLDRSALLLERGRLRAAYADLLRARQTDPFNRRVLAAIEKLSARIPGARPR